MVTKHHQKKVATCIQTLRAIIGDNKQHVFAARVGISRILLAKIETLDRNLSADVANQIEAATGVMAEALVRGQLLNRNEQPYTREDFLDYTRSEYEPEEIALLKESFMQDFRAFSCLFDSAGRRQKVRLFETLFNRFLLDATKKLEIEAEFDKTLSAMGDFGAMAANRLRRRRKLAKEKKPLPRPKYHVIAQGWGVDVDTIPSQ